MELSDVLNRLGLGECKSLLVPPPSPLQPGESPLGSCGVSYQPKGPLQCQRSAFFCSIRPVRTLADKMISVWWWSLPTSSSNAPRCPERLYLGH